jgi:hypothetical protein
MAVLAVIEQPGLLPLRSRARIDAVIARSLNGEKPLDRLSAAHLQRALAGGHGGSADGPAS